MEEESIQTKEKEKSDLELLENKATSALVDITETKGKMSGLLNRLRNQSESETAELQPDEPAPKNRVINVGETILKIGTQNLVINKIILELEEILN